MSKNRYSAVYLALLWTLLAPNIQSASDARSLSTQTNESTQTPSADASATRIAALETQVAKLQSTPQASMPSLQFVFGDALELLPIGDPDVVAVIAVGTPVGYTVPVVLRNNTGEDLALRGVLGIARDSTGSLLATGDFSTSAPFILLSGEVAIAIVRFWIDTLPSNATLEFYPTTRPLAGTLVSYQDLQIVQAGIGSDSVRGLALNNGTETLSLLIDVVGVCFDDTGVVRGFYEGYEGGDDVLPGRTLAFDVPEFGTGPCTRFLVGANSFRL